MKKTRITRFFSLLLCCLMLVGLLPLGQVAYAAGEPSLQNVTLSADGILSWDAFDGAGAYYCYVGEGLPGSGWKDGTSVNIREMCIAGGKTSGTYSIELYAAATKGGEPISATWTGSYNYVAEKPQLEKPWPVNWTGNIASWGAVPNAEEYVVWLWDENDSQKNIGTVATTSVDLTEYLAPGTHKYRFSVRAVATGYPTSDWSLSEYETLTHTLPPMQNVTLTSNGILSWNAFPGADEYFWEYCRAGHAVRKHVNETSVDIRDILTKTGSAYGTYEIRLYALKGIVQLSDEWVGTYDFTEPATFTVTFNANGHGTAPAAQSVKDGKTATKPADPTASGWKFGGWYREAACTNAFDFSTPITGDITLFAKWEKEPYKVTFDMQGHGTAPATQYVDDGGYATRPSPDPSAEGWTFGGWYNEAACTNEFYFASKAIHEDTVIYAKWTGKHKVTFDMQGHGTAPATQYVDNGGYATRPSPNPSAEGWEFRGWFRDEAYNYEFDFSTWTITHDTTIYAKWAEKTETYLVSYDNGGGSGSVAPYGARYNAAHMLRPADTFGPPSADKEFDQWEVTIGTAEPQRMNPGEIITITAKTTIKALWKDKGATTFAFTTQPVSGTAKKTENYTYSWALNDTPDTIVLQAWRPVENDWVNHITLSGASGSGTIGLWSGILDSNKSKYRIQATKGSKTICSDEFTVTWTDESSTFAFTTQPTSGTAKETENYTYSWALNDTPDTIVLQAWRPVENDWVNHITLSGASGSGTISLWSGILDGNVSKYRIYAFKGSETIYSNEFTVTWLDDSVTTYTVTFDANGHGTAPTAQTVESGKTATKPADPTATGWIFGGWYQDKTCNVAFDFSTPITGAITLYAKWTKNGGETPTYYTVTFDANGHGTAPAAQNVESGKTATKPADPTETGWTFGGWYTEAACTNAFDFSTPITGAITLYAKWTKNTGGGVVIPTVFPVTVKESDNGEVEASAKYAVPGSTVKLTVTPDESYELDTLTVKSGSKFIDVTEKNGKYQFVMPFGSATVTATFKAVNPYNDVDTDDWFYDDVLYVTLKDLMNGTGNGKFSPEITTDRAMLVTVLWRLEGCPVVDSSVDFDDVADGLWYSDAIDWASANGIVNGYGDGKFGPTDQITREQIMAILNRYAAYKNWTDGTALPMIPQYNCSIWAENNVIWADMNGLLNGLGVDITDMTAKASRAELAAYLAKFYKEFAEN